MTSLNAFPRQGASTIALDGLAPRALARIAAVSIGLLLLRLPPTALRVAQALLRRHQIWALQRALTHLNGRVLRESGLDALLRDETRCGKSGPP